jgi:YidC/Oxa1 family membrane protein insertase
LAIPNFDLRWFTFLNPHWSLSLASADPTHILPVLAALATFIQLRMSQARNRQQPGKSDMMTQQMQIMSFIMPFVTLFIAWSFPAGLALYWTTTSIFSMVQQYFVTGWGSLFSLPALGGGKPKDVDRSGPYIGDTRKEQALLSTGTDSQEVRSERTISTRANGYSAGSSTRRRRPNSSSARRRGAAPRRNPSRS